MTDISKIINYFARCYRADSYDLSISNISKIRKDRCLLIKHDDVLASGEMNKDAIVGEIAENLNKQVDIYRKEKRLIYACLMVKGQVKTASTFGDTRKIYSPILYFPANLSSVTEDFEGDMKKSYVTIDTQDLRVNLPLLRSILKPDVESSVTDSFPSVEWPLTSFNVGVIGQWLEKYTLIDDVLDLARWPKYFEQEKSTDLAINANCCLLLADRSKGARGVLHELNEIRESDDYSSAIKALFETDEAVWQQMAMMPSSPSEPDVLPNLLSDAQIVSLDNAAKYPLNLISGPPGTGKSFTISAIAMDRMLQGEKVLIVSKTDQAIDVVNKKLKYDYGLNDGFIHTNNDNYLKSIKSYLDQILNEGIELHGNANEVKLKLKNVVSIKRKYESKFEKLLWAEKHISTESSASFWKRVKAGLIRFVYQGEQLWDIQEKVSKLQVKYEEQSIRYINISRKQQLQDLLKNDRKHLVTFSQALRSRTSKTQQDRFSRLDMNVVFKAFPIWMISLDNLNKVLPNIKEMFDLVIVDEATQCDIASAIPALYRAKRAVVVGDRKQLRHVSFLSRTQQDAIWNNAELTDRVIKFSYRDQSLLDLVPDSILKQQAVTLLDEHYRSKPDLIAFSNQHFYSNKLKIMQARPNNILSSLEFHRLEGERTKSGRNQIEVDWVIENVKNQIAQYKATRVKPSIGVLSPYREQAEYIDSCLRKAVPYKDLEDHDIRISTPYGFQGEERDIMLLSMGIDNDSIRASGYLNREDMFNVAITRAREKQMIAFSVDPELLSDKNLFRRYCHHKYKAIDESVGYQQICNFSEQLCQKLKASNLNVWQAFMIAGQEIDVVCEYQGKVIGIDLIGYAGDMEDYFSVKTYKTLLRAGVEIIPMGYSQWKNDPKICVDYILAKLGIKTDDAERL